MALTRQLTMLGVDVSERVLSWGSIEQIKDVLLVTATLMTSEMSMGLEDFDGGITKMVNGTNWYHKDFTVTVDGQVVYQGLLKDIKSDYTKRNVTVKSENIFVLLTETSFVLTATSINPAVAMLSIAQSAMPDENINIGSFAAAGNPSALAGATINLVYAAGSNTTCLKALQEIGTLAGISVFVIGNRLTARAVIPYQGNDSGMKFPIDGTNVREWSNIQYDTSSFNNIVQVGYGAGLYVKRTDDISRRVNNIDRQLQFPSSSACASSNQVSATYFANMYLARAAHRKTLVSVAGGREFKGINIGDRFPVTNPTLGLNNMPMEAIEMKRNLDSEEVEISLAELRVN